MTDTPATKYRLPDDQAQRIGDAVRESLDPLNPAMRAAALSERSTEKMTPSVLAAAQAIAEGHVAGINFGVASAARNEHHDWLHALAGTALMNLAVAAHIIANERGIEPAAALELIGETKHNLNAFLPIFVAPDYSTRRVVERDADGKIAAVVEHR